MSFLDSDMKSMIRASLNGTSWNKTLLGQRINTASIRPLSDYGFGNAQKSNLIYLRKYNAVVSPIDRGAHAPTTCYLCNVKHAVAFQAIVTIKHNDNANAASAASFKKDTTTTTNIKHMLGRNCGTRFIALQRILSFLNHIVSRAKILFGGSKLSGLSLDHYVSNEWAPKLRTLMERGDLALSMDKGITYKKRSRSNNKAVIAGAAAAAAAAAASKDDDEKGFIKTKEGYCKDGFVVDDEEDEEEISHRKKKSRAI